MARHEIPRGSFVFLWDRMLWRGYGVDLSSTGHPAPPPRIQVRCSGRRHIMSVHANRGGSVTFIKMSWGEG